MGNNVETCANVPFFINKKKKKNSRRENSSTLEYIEKQNPLHPLFLSHTSCISIYILCEEKQELNRKPRADKKKKNRKPHDKAWIRWDIEFFLYKKTKTSINSLIIEFEFSHPS